jgi:heterodisulfide reductase subunit C
MHVLPLQGFRLFLKVLLQSPQPNNMMDKFGFAPASDHQIDFDANDRRIAEYVQKHEITFDLCISCGSCTATCSAGNQTDFNFRKLNIYLKRGEIAHLEGEIKKCMFCGKCQLVCPRGVNTRQLILHIQKALEKYKNNGL